MYRKRKKKNLSNNNVGFSLKWRFRKMKLTGCIDFPAMLLLGLLVNCTLSVLGKLRRYPN